MRMRGISGGQQASCDSRRAVGQVEAPGYAGHRDSWRVAIHFGIMRIFEVLKTPLIFPLEEIPELLMVFTAGDYATRDQKGPLED